jgi:hypothetical protein
MIRRRITTGLAILIMLAGIQGCKKESEEDKNQNYAKGYTGTLTMEYTRDFPEFDAIIHINVAVSGEGIMTSGPSVSCLINAEDTFYEGIEPKLRMRLNGSMTLHETQGNTYTLDGTQYMGVLVHSTIQYQETVWFWDDDNQQWVQFIDAPVSYSDEYSDGEFQFNMVNAQLGGSEIKATLPDLQGTFTYGYMLFLIPNP